MLLRIISAEGELYKGEVQKILLPTENGFLGIFPGHANLVTPLIAGQITYLSQEQPKSALDSFSDYNHNIEIGGGLAMVEDDIITIAAE